MRRSLRKSFRARPNSTDAAKSFVAPVLASSSINYTLSRCAPSLLALHLPQRILTYSTRLQ
ncbi:MAG: hypothetical protein K2W97_09355 [Chthoniobacterales bacterium]|nr:hypothetical protein [Chthoniobacterales bacterium]